MIDEGFDIFSFDVPALYRHDVPKGHPYLASAKDRTDFEFVRKVDESIGYWKTDVNKVKVQGGRLKIEGRFTCRDEWNLKEHSDEEQMGGMG